VLSREKDRFRSESFFVYNDIIISLNSNLIDL